MVGPFCWHHQHGRKAKEMAIAKLLVWTCLLQISYERTKWVATPRGWRLAPLDKK